MKNHIPLIIYFILIFSLSPLTNIYGCTPPDTAGTITGSNTTCYGQKVTYIVPAIGFAGSYKWSLPASTQIISGANTDTITLVFNGSGGMIRVQGVNSCDTGVSSSFLVKVNGLPKINLIAPQKFCCDYGNIALGSSAFGSPTGGVWSCRQNASFMNSNVFLTPTACDPKKATAFTLIYSYQDPTTTCINTDSTYFSINPLPPLIFKDGAHCQDKMEVRLQTHVLAPVNLNTMAAVSWRLLKTLPKPGGTSNKISDLIYDASPGLSYDFRLKIDTGTIDLGAGMKDSLILEVTIQDVQGCFNRDTATIRILKVPGISFNAFPELCIDAGILNLTKISNATPDKGCWSVIKKSGYADSVNLTPGIKKCDTLNTFMLSLQNGPGLYWMRYVQNSGGCASSMEMQLRIHPLPKVNISLSPNSYSGKYCEIDGDVTLNAAPVGGTWTCPVAGAISGSVFRPGSVGPADRDKWITLTYSYANPMTKCDTAKSLQVFVQSRPLINILTPDMDTCRSDTMDIKLTATYYYTSKISWIHNANPLNAGFENNQQLSNKNPTIFTIRPRSDSATIVKIWAFTEAEGVCPFDMDTMDIRIDTIPCDPVLGIQTGFINNPFDVAIFPNPNQGRFSMEIKRAGNYRTKLYSITGELIFERKTTGFKTETIDQKLSAGNYILTIEDIHSYSTRKRVIVK